MPRKKHTLTERKLRLFIALFLLLATSHVVAGPARQTVHWSFQLVTKPALPHVDDSDWCRTPIDRFVFDKLAEAGLEPSPETDRRTWLRRATYNLRGLPPTPEELREFQEDRAPGAHARVVDRLLAEPQYGERWARHWLDVARYSDTKGHATFADGENRWAYTYRDYVIESLNEDRPFDQFVLEQIAADLLHRRGEAPRRSLRALGFLTLGPGFMNEAHLVIDDRIDVVTRGFLGLTVSCARCHDHKYDPVPTEDYYSLYGVFASTNEPRVLPLFEDPEETEEYRKFDAEYRTRMGKLDAYIDSKYRAVSEDARTRIAGYMLAAHEADKRPSTVSFMFVVDPGDLNPYVILRWQAFLHEKKANADPVFAAWHAFTEIAGDHFEAQAGAVLDRLRHGNGHALVLQSLADSPLRSLKDVAKAYEQVLIAPRASAISQPDLGALVDVLHGTGSPADIPAPDQGLNQSWIFPDRASQGEHSRLFLPVIQWLRDGPGAPARAMVIEDRAKPVDPRVFVRGNPTVPGKNVPRQFLAALSGEGREPFRDGSGRLELARAIASKNNPLTARVFVNRVWMHHFGKSLVESPDDFGMRSEKPTHSELLDWLAATFMESGWSIKRLHREILLSAVFRQESRDEDSSSARDPDNDLLGSANRRRLDFESMRDTLLDVSSRLDRRVGGLSNAVLGSRRTVYTRIDRLEVPGLLRTFDFPDPFGLSARRAETTVAPQALFFMNHSFVVDRAQEILRRVGISDSIPDDATIDGLYALLFQRDPDPDERTMARAFLNAPRSATALHQDWSYGFIRGSESAGRPAFASFDRWTGARLESARTPAYLDARGGEPHAPSSTAVVRRWTARRSSAVSVSGMLHHASSEPKEDKEPEDGVRARVISNIGKTIATWDAKGADVSTEIQRVEVREGDILDFVVDGRENGKNDGFEWTLTVREEGPGSSSDKIEARTWDSHVDFRGPQVDANVQYVQALLMLNEFIFID